MLQARRWLTAALLGLPAALTAHALLFGNQHAAGGSLHGPALAAAIVAAVFVIAVRFRERSGRFEVLAVSTAGWFALLELSEHPHGVAVVPAVIALLAAAILVRATVHFAASSLRAIAVALSGVQVLRADSRPSITLRREGPAHLQITAHRYALFSRPPPLLS
jgi:hypothetical protein